MKILLNKTDLSYQHTINKIICMVVYGFGMDVILKCSIKLNEININHCLLKRNKNIIFVYCQLLKKKSSFFYITYENIQYLSYIIEGKKLRKKLAIPILQFFQTIFWSLSDRIKTIFINFKITNFIFLWDKYYILFINCWEDSILVYHLRFKKLEKDR